MFNPKTLQPWRTSLQAGEVVAAPAEGVYGYCCDPFNEAALTKLMHLKRRSPSKGLIVLIRDVSQLSQLCPQPLPDDCIKATEAHWLGTANHQPSTINQPTTLILPALPTLSKLLTGAHTTLAIRLPHSPYMQEYLKAWGQPLVSTSMNISGEPAAAQANQVPAGIPALTLPTPLTGQSSRIFNPLTGTWLR